MHNIRPTEHHSTNLSPEEICRALEPFLSGERKVRYETVLQNRSLGLTLVIDRIHHEHNISAVIRSADAFGIHKVHLVGNQLSEQSLKLSKGIALGSDRWVERLHHDDAIAAINSLKAEGYQLVVLQAPMSETGLENSASVPIDKLPFEKKKLALVFGNEVSGVSQPFFQLADYRAFIPMYGFVESFNISVAAAICLHEHSKARNKLPVFPLSQAEINYTKSQWLLKDIRGAELILKRLYGS